jgi:hypothetical protein
MATAPARISGTVDDLLAAVKQLAPEELREFQRQFTAWSGLSREPNRASSPEGGEEAFLAAIRENATLPAAEQRRFNRLRRKQQSSTLTGAEEKQLQAVWSRVEQMNVARLAALVELARRRNTDVRTLMRQLGLPENCDIL